MEITAILIALAAISNSIMDKLKFHYSKSRFSKLKGFWKWWFRPTSWKNKWKNGDPNQGEAFFGSATIFVMITNAWHFFKAVMLNCFFVITAFYLYDIWWHIVLCVLALNMVYGIVFELLFSWLWVSPGEATLGKSWPSYLFRLYLWFLDRRIGFWKLINPRHSNVIKNRREYYRWLQKLFKL